MGRRHSLSRSTAAPVKIKRSRCSEEQMIAISKKQEGDGEGGRVPVSRGQRGNVFRVEVEVTCCPFSGPV